MFPSKLFCLLTANRFVKKFLFLVSAIALLSANIYAYTFDCNNLYIAKDYYTYTVNPSTSTTATAVTSDNGVLPTLALGYRPNSNTLRMYRWNIGYNDGGSGISYLDSGGSNNWATYTHTPGSFNPMGENPTGGEVNQLTGEIYMTGSWLNAYTGSSASSLGTFGIGVHNPATQSLRQSRVLTPGHNYYVASDMAIDAEGNAYVLVTDGSDDNNDWSLMRINIKNPDGSFKSTPWTGDIVRSISNIDSDWEPSDIWGIAFLEGKLYFGGRLHSGYIYNLDPLTGVVNTNNPIRTSTYETYDILDLASCQVAPVIRGTIYNDEDADGVITGQEAGISGVTVQLYSNGGTLLGETKTVNDGSYSFILNSLDSNFYVRVKQPMIGGVHAAQTWASGGAVSTNLWGGGTNTVYNYCFNGTNDAVESNSSRTCYGARRSGIEPSANGISAANYYSKVHAQVSTIVSHADFAFSVASDRSDSNQPEVLHNLAVRDALGNYRAYLGSNVTRDPSTIRGALANTDVGDDGLSVLVNGRYIPVQQRGFVRGAPYSFKADINGTLKNNATLSTWLSAANDAAFMVNTAMFAGPISNTTSGADSIFFTGTTPNDGSGVGSINRTLRARFTTSMGVTAINSAGASNDPWVMDGEVEDYRVFLLQRQVRLALKTKGTSGNSGNFNFQLTNVANTSPSSANVTFSTPAPDVITDEPIGVTHEIITQGADVVVRIDRPQTLGIMQSETTCTDINNANANVPLSFLRYESGGRWYDNVTLLGAGIKGQSDIACLFTYGTAPVITINANVTNRAFADDNFNLTLSDINASSVIASNSTTSGTNATSISAILAADHTNNISISMVAGSTGALERYKIEAICSGANPSTVTNGWFTLNATFADNITCSVTLTASTISSTNSGIEVIPQDNDAGNTSLVLITLKDTNNITLPSGGDTVEVFITSPVVMQLSNTTHSIYSPTTSNITAIDNNNGTYRAYITSNLTGEANLTFSTNGIMANSYAVAKFHHLTPDLDSSSTNITIIPPSTVNVGNNATALISVADKFGNAVTNATIALRVIADTTGGTPTLYNSNALNNNDGTYEINLTSAKQGNVTVSFSVNSINVNHSKNATATFIASDGNASSPYSNITITPNDTIVGNAALITVYLSDNAGHNGISGQDVRVVFIDGKQNNATIYPDNTNYQMNDNATLGSGYYTAWINSTIADSYTLSFKVGQSGNVSIHNASILYRPADIDLNSTYSYITASPTTPIDNNSTIRVYLSDKHNNTVKNATVGVRVIAGDTGNFSPIGSNDSISFTADALSPKGGYYQVFYTTPIAGSVTFGFSANGIKAEDSNNATTNFTSSGPSIQSNYTVFTATPKDNGVGDSVTLNLYLADNNSNPQAGYTVAFYVESRRFDNGTTVNNGDGVYISNVIDNGNGTYTATASTNRSANVTFYFDVDSIGDSYDDSPYKTDWANFKHGSVDLGNPNTTITATSFVLVDTNSTVVVTLRDKDNNPVNNESVTVKVLSGASGTFSPPTATVTQDGSGNGEYVVYFATPVSGNVTFGFEVGGQENASKNATTIFMSGAADSATSELTFNPPGSSPVSVESFATATATIKDGNGNARPNTLVDFSVNGGTIDNSTHNGSALTCLTDYSGKCSVVWTSTVTGVFAMNATINGGSHITNSPANKTFTAGVANETTSIFVLENGPKVVGGSFSMNTTLKDRYGNAIPNQFVYYAVTPAIPKAGFGSYGSEPDNLTDTTGTAALSATTFWSDIAGDYIVTVRFGGESGPEVSGSNQTMRFVPASANASYSNLTISSPGPQDSQGGFYTLRVYAKDAVGNNPVPNTDVVITVSNGTLQARADVKSRVCTTNALGWCEYDWTSPDEKGNFTVTATIYGENVIGSPAAREFRSLSADALESTLEILEAGPKTADGTDAYTIRVTLRDNGTLPTGGSVNIAVSGGLLNSAVTGGSYTVDETTGQLILYWTSTDANNFTINATIGANEMITGSPQTREFTAGSANASNSVFTITPNADVIADNSSSYNLSVNIKDSYNNKKQGAVVTFRVEEGYLNNGTVSPSTITCTTLADGNCSVTWFSDKIGNFSVNATVSGDIIGSNQYRNFIQGAASNVTSTLVVTPNDTRTADNISYFTATANIKDALSHSVTGELVTFKVSGGWIANTTHDGTTLTCVTDSSGSCFILWRSETPGIFTISADISAGVIGSESREFTATTAKAANSTLEVTPDGPVGVGSGYYSVKVTALDDGAIPAPGATVTIAVSGGELNATTCNTDSSGECHLKWTSNISGNFSINATIGGAALGGSGDPLKGSPQYRLFNAGLPTSANSSLVITPGNRMVVANSGNYYTLNITARDIYGNGVPNQSMSAWIEYGELDNGTGFVAGNTTCLTDSGGNCFVFWRSDKVGEFNVNVTISGESTPIYSTPADKKRIFAYANVNEITSYILVTSYNATQPDYIPVCVEDEASIASCGSYYSVTAFVKDVADNHMAGHNATFYLVRGGKEVRDAYWNDIITAGTNGEASCTISADGFCTANLTLKANIMGEYEIRASVDGVYIHNGLPEIRRFVAGDPDPSKSYIVFNPTADNIVAADNSSYYNATVVLSDGANNPVGNNTVTISVPLGNDLDNGTRSTTVTCLTNEGGNCSVLWRSAVAHLPQSINAQAQNLASNLTGNRTFTTGAFNPNMSNITVSSRTATTDESVNVTVTVNDSFGSPIIATHHDVVIYTSLANSSFANGTGNHTGTLTNVNGTYTAVLNSTNIGNTTLTFSVDGVMSANTEWVYFTSGSLDMDPSNNNSYITAQSPVEVGDNSLATVYLGDRYGNPISNKSVTVYVLYDNVNGTAGFHGGSNSIMIPSSQNGDGSYTANLTAFDKGNVTVSFIVDGKDGKDYNKTAPVLFRTGTPNATSSTIYVTHEVDNSTDALADGVDYYTVNVTVRDTFNATVENANVILVVDKGNISATNSSMGSANTISCVTDANGVCTTYWMSLDWGDGNISAYIGSIANDNIVGASPITRTFQRTRLDDNLTITDFTPSSKRAKIGDLVRYSVKVKNNV
ncbi:MAG: hypothetical protein LBQ18_05010, partial [Campylobacteraceae bacterium]|nr:hypothetical protein [Campylobacteraceae bacterium]